MVDISEYSQMFRDKKFEEISIAERTLANGLEALRLQRDLDIINKYAQGPNFCDFPIGTGRIYPNFQDRFNVFGYDICGVYVDYARSKQPDFVENFQECCFEDPYDKVKMDTIVSLRVFNNIGDKKTAMKNIARILNNNGVWLLNIPPVLFNDATFHTNLKQAGFTIEDYYGYDWVSSWKQMNKLEARFRQVITKFADLKLLPYFLYKIIDHLMPRKGLIMVVARKTL
ncbi:methyltransferase domain-containing protein [Terasakiella sp. SH-1]|uniref:methyltransferase domain-containing protein n=1 Tax=Terasakiella sp. SH-1 TaxID=2560057 RepID=UPI001074403F|nr:methyltransferase domain-containing protein [Terasakiella sp. SH-1]